VDLVREGPRVIARPRAEEVREGVFLQFRPTVSADRRSLGLDVVIENATIGSVKSIPMRATFGPGHNHDEILVCRMDVPEGLANVWRENVSIPDGRTAVFKAWTNKRVGQNAYGSPIVSQFPFVSRVFKEVQEVTETETTYVLVTPRILINEPEDVVQTGYIAPAPLAKEVKYVVGWERCSTVIGLAGGACAGGSPDGSKHVVQVLQIYRQACAQGQRDLARKLALLAIEMDPTCFGTAGRAECSTPR
jgi:hypothetical protein